MSENQFDKIDKCSWCGKIIPNGEDYYSLQIHRELKNGINIKVQTSIQLALWCKKCHGEHQNLLKTNISVIK